MGRVKTACQVPYDLLMITVTKVLHVHDPMIGMMGALSWVTSFMVWALATQGWMMYLATGLSSIGTHMIGRIIAGRTMLSDIPTSQVPRPTWKMTFTAGGEPVYIPTSHDS